MINAYVNLYIKSTSDEEEEENTGTTVKEPEVINLKQENVVTKRNVSNMDCLALRT